MISSSTSTTLSRGAAHQLDAPYHGQGGGHQHYPLGGDFAGFVAKFAPTTGDLVPVPVHLVPDELIMWGQVPSSLEILVSERVSWGGVGSTSGSDENGDADTSSEGNCRHSDVRRQISLKRQTITVLPAVGCRVDNLDTTQPLQEFFSTEATEVWQDSRHPSMITLDSDMAVESFSSCTLSRKEQKLYLETVFALPDVHRIRVSMTLQTCLEYQNGIATDTTRSYEIESPLCVYMERQTSQTSSDGKQFNRDGSLDGRTLVTLLGETLRQQQQAFNTKLTDQNSFANQEDAVAGSQTDDISSRIYSFHLPGNIIGISSTSCKDGKNDWILEVSHTMTSGSTESNGDGHSDITTRRSLQRFFQGGKCTARHSSTTKEAYSDP